MTSEAIWLLFSTLCFQLLFWSNCPECIILFIECYYQVVTFRIWLSYEDMDNLLMKYSAYLEMRGQFADHMDRNLGLIDFTAQ